MIMEVLQNVFQRIFGRWEDKPDDQQYYVKILFAIFSGIICAAGGQTFAGIRGLMLGLLIYALSLYVLVYLLKFDPEEFGGRQKLITKTSPSYLLLWVLLWTVLFAFALSPEILAGL
jgi:amino acid permease